MVEEYGRVDFRDQISKNKWKTLFLIVIIFLVFLLLGFVIGMALGEGYVFIIMIISIIISILYILFSYYKSAEIAIASVRARPVNSSNPDERQYERLVEALTVASGLPKPKLYVMENEMINAFASGRSPDVAVLCVTTGALKKLDKKELEGVLAHELGHVGNYDIRYLTIVAVMVGMISIFSEIFLRSLWFKSGDNDSKAGVIFLVLGIVLAILAPIIVWLVQMSISRKREYAADATAVKFTRYPQGLIGALKKIKNDHGETSTKEHKIPKATAHLFFANPFKNWGSTHPPLEDRIRVLERM